MLTQKNGEFYTFLPVFSHILSIFYSYNKTLAFQNAGICALYGKNGFSINEEQEEKVEIFNIGTGRGLSVLELIHAFEESTGVKLNYQIVGRREGDIEQVWAKPDKANTVLGWSADTPIEEVLLSAWKWEQKIRS